MDMRSVDWMKLIIEIGMALGAALLPVLAKLAGSALSAFIANSHNVLLQKGAAIAIAAAEDTLKSDSGKGTEKLDQATDSLLNFAAKHGIKIDSKGAEEMIRATYQGLMGSLAPSKNG